LATSSSKELMPERAFSDTVLVIMVEDYRPFEIVSVLQNGRSVGITSAYDAAKYILENWPDEAAGPKLENCKEILLTCLAGECSAALARVLAP
jgi:Protein of unknown function (DUF982)